MLFNKQSQLNHNCSGWGQSNRIFRQPRRKGVKVTTQSQKL